jgi:hypothetical protein
MSTSLVLAMALAVLAIGSGAAAIVNAIHLNMAKHGEKSGRNFPAHS